MVCCLRSHDSGLGVICCVSFQNVVEQKEEGDLKRVTFARSPIMSTYLLAFIVGEFDYVEEKDVNGLLVRVYTPVGKAEQGRFALDVSHTLSGLNVWKNTGLWSHDPLTPSSYGPMIPLPLLPCLMIPLPPPPMVP